MCLAIMKPAGCTLNKADMRRAYQANNDGCGLAVRRKGRIHIEKGLWTFEECWRRIAAYQAQEMLVHFRFASKGRVTDANCHPFAVARGGALIHNGHLDGYGTQEQSDTAHWVESVLNPIVQAYPDAMRHAAMRQLLSDSLGGDKMVLMLPEDTYILNAAHGHWDEGIWYSNASYAMPRSEEPPAWPWRGEHALSLDIPSGWSEEGCECCGMGHGLYRVCQTCLYGQEEVRWSDGR